MVLQSICVGGKVPLVVRKKGDGEKIFCNFEKLKKLIKNKVCTSFVNLYLMFLYL